MDTFVRSASSCCSRKVVRSQERLHRLPCVAAAGFDRLVGGQFEIALAWRSTFGRSGHVKCS
ncbi:hypothetical protein ACVL92_000772 [Bradyrhizobium liaoningense]